MPLADHMMAARTALTTRSGGPSVAQSQSGLVCGAKRPRFRRVGDGQAAEHWRACLPGLYWRWCCVGFCGQITSYPSE